MEKLELKHLAPYLPYGLKRHCPSSNVMIHDYTAMEFTQGTCDRHQSYGWKPILRPLSDLTKEIEHNGETFLPMSRFYGNPLDYKINELPYKVFVKLVELHFDVFGLIEKGLAVPVTENFNPYE